MELTQEMIQRRYEKASASVTPVSIYGLSDLVFIPLGAKGRGISSRAYSQRVMQLYKEGYPSKAVINKILKDTCEQQGLNYKLLDKKVALQKKLFDSIPPELSGPYDQLTQEEIAELSPFDREKRDKAVGERGKKIAEFIANVYTAEEKDELEQIKMIEQLEQQLLNNTAEHHAQRHQMVTEILHCARKQSDSEQAYFANEDEFENIKPSRALVDLFMAWRQYREGMPSDFFSR